MQNVRLFFTGLALTFFLAGCGGGHSHDHDKSHAKDADGTQMDASKQGPEFTSAYICPMHCKGSGSDQPGKCPACGMDYVANKEYHEGHGADHDEGGHDEEGHEGHDHD